MKGRRYAFPTNEWQYHHSDQDQILQFQWIHLCWHPCLKTRLVGFQGFDPYQGCPRPLSSQFSNHHWYQLHWNSMQSTEKKNVIKWARPKALLSIRDNVAYFKTQFILIRSISSWSVSACVTFTCTTGTSVSVAACTCTTGTSFSAAATFSIPCHHGKEYQSQNRLHLQKRKKKKKKWSTVFQKQSETNDCLG